jgi:hypothetical protein
MDDIIDLLTFTEDYVHVESIVVTPVVKTIVWTKMLDFHNDYKLNRLIANKLFVDIFENIFTTFEWQSDEIISDTIVDYIRMLEGNEIDNKNLRDLIIALESEIRRSLSGLEDFGTMDDFVNHYYIPGDTQAYYNLNDYSLDTHGNVTAILNRYDVKYK